MPSVPERSRSPSTVTAIDFVGIAHRRRDHLAGDLRARGERAEQQIAGARSRSRAAHARVGLGLVDRAADVDRAGDRRAGLAAARGQRDARGLRVRTVLVLERFLERSQVHEASAPILRGSPLYSLRCDARGRLRLGPYEILAPLGAGGMGEVYRARDTKLSREVAIKVLPEALAQRRRAAGAVPPRGAGPGVAQPPAHRGDLRARGAGGLEALILELVEGETLAERIARGPLPSDEALEIARQIADALEAAHEKGIVHRDLKPANVKLDPDGQVKVLDFGLAKALPTDGSSPDITSSPTMTAAATQAGVVLGTAAYMSPEQARGKSVDKRADIWAFATVLYEMLTGRKAFEGETVSDTLAAVLTKEPDWSALPAETPASVRRVLRRCLDRDPKTRIHDIADARLELDEPPAAAGRPGADPVPELPRPGLGVARRPRSRARGRRPAGGWRCGPRPTAAPPRVDRLTPSPFPEGEQIPFDDSPVLDLSRDGDRLVFIGERDGQRQLYVRSRDRIEPKPVAGTEGAYSPFFSPDGQWIGFFADGKAEEDPGLRRRRRSRSPTPRTTAAGYGSQDDTIVFAPDFTSGLSRVVRARGEGRGADDAGRRRRASARTAGRRICRETRPCSSRSACSRAPAITTTPASRSGSPRRASTRILFEGGSMPRVRASGPPRLLAGRRDVLAARFDSRRRTRARRAGRPRREDERRRFERRRVCRLALPTAPSPSCPEADGRRAPSLLTDRAGKARPVPVPPRSYHLPALFAGRKAHRRVDRARGTATPTTSGSATSRRAPSRD